MRLCRYQTIGSEPRVGWLRSSREVVDLTAAGIATLDRLWEEDEPEKTVKALARSRLPRLAIARVRLLAPVDQQEIWAAGVTYRRSKTARMTESSFGASAYDRVYAAERPELFFKALAAKVSGPGEPVGRRYDSRWSVPEPELALMINSRGRVVGVTLGNDLSARDIEGENLLYLPQAKIYARSCALGPVVVVGCAEERVRTWSMHLRVHRGGRLVFSGETPIGRIRRGFAELASWLYRCQELPWGAVLLTGTGIVPPDDMTLQAGDQVVVSIPEVGVLANPVVVVGS